MRELGSDSDESSEDDEDNEDDGEVGEWEATASNSASAKPSAEKFSITEEEGSGKTSVE